MRQREQLADEDSDTPTVEPAKRPRRRGRRVVLVVFLVLLLLVGGGAVVAGLYLHSVESSVKRVPAFVGVPDDLRPVKVAKGAMNLLLLGSDSRDPENTSGSRSDTIIVGHVSRGHSSAQLVSIPRDTWLRIPRSADGRHGNVDAKINAAYAWGGIPLVVQTVEHYTGIRIDHVVLIDFAGFKEIVDALGGITINVDQSFTSTHSLNANSIRHFDKGSQQMDGAAALDYARERYAFNDGDFARIRHQQQVIKAILDKASSGGLLTNPARLNSFLRATAHAVAVDETLDILGMAADLRGLNSGDLSFYTSPSKGTGQVADQSVVFPDTQKASVLFDAMRRDSVSEIAAAAK
jgi:LCP family protein required for cell wall assembly